MGYTMSTIKELVKHGVEIHVVHWDKGKLTPYTAEHHDNVFFYPRSIFTYDTLLNIVDKIKPSITVVSGWQDKLYFKVSERLRSSGMIVVGCIDNQWERNIKRLLASALGEVNYFYRRFSFAWVAGSYQYEYARMIGFKKKDIIYDLYSADTSIFGTSFNISYSLKKNKYPHRFLYIGRFEYIKGLDLLLEAWDNIKPFRSDWELCLIGNGSLKELLLNNKDIKIKNFTFPNDLVHEMINGGCLILPSRHEPWGVVVHESALTGLPLILSDSVGSSIYFMINRFNGYSVKSGAVDSLATAMLQIINHSDVELLNMCNNSNILSKRISPQTSAQNLLSIIS